ncbi:MAG: beta-ketoacyl synthase chain length factor [Cellvibrionaceae bacterium]
MSLKILAIASYCEPIASDGALPELKEMVKISTGVVVRRVTRFVQLALIGAGRCCENVEVAPDTGVYFSSCRGDTEVTASLLEDLISRKELPSPVTFVNSVSNAACFHVARALGLHDRNNFVTNRFDPIVAALTTAYVDITRGEIATALVGSVDSASAPLARHRQRLQVNTSTVIGEGSHWMLVASPSDPRKGIGTIPGAHNFSGWEQLQAWLVGTGDYGNWLLAPGQHLSETDANRIAELIGTTACFDYSRNLPYYDSQTGAAIEQFIRERNEPGMLHVNSDPAGRYSVVLVER